MQDDELQPKGASGVLQFRGRARCFRIVRIEKQGDGRNVREKARRV